MSDRFGTAVTDYINTLEGVPHYLIGINASHCIESLQLEQDEADKLFLPALYRLSQLDAEDLEALDSLFRAPSSNPDEPVPRQFSLSDCDVLLGALLRVRNPELLARLRHLTWLRTRCYPSSLRAILLYLKSASELLQHHESPSACNDVFLAAHIAILLGKDHVARQRVAESIRNFVERTADSAEVNHLLKALMTLSSDTETSFAYIRAAREAGRCSRDGNEFLSHDLFLLAADCASQLHDQRHAELCRRLAAESYARLASKFGSSSPGPFVAAHWLSVCIQELCSFPGTQDRREQLGRDLARMEQESVTNMPSHSVNIALEGDDAAAMEQLFLSVTGKSLEESILVMALCSDWLQIEHAVPIDKHASILDLIKHTVVDSYGKPVAEYVPVDGDPTAPSLDSARLHWAVSTLVVETLRVRIVSEHPIDIDSLQFLIKQNPLIPPGHENAILSALTVGLNGDWISVGHFLIPKTEMILRHLLLAGGMYTRRIGPDGRESEMTLDELVASPTAKEMLDPGLLLDLQYILCTKPLGLGWRNLEAHGLARDEDYSQPAIEYLWWLFLRWFVLFSRRTLFAMPVACRSGRISSSATVPAQ